MKATKFYNDTNSPVLIKSSDEQLIVMPYNKTTIQGKKISVRKFDKKWSFLTYISKTKNDKLQNVCSKIIQSIEGDCTVKLSAHMAYDFNSHLYFANKHGISIVYTKSILHPNTYFCSVFGN